MSISELYKYNSANYPKMEVDSFFSDENDIYEFEGYIDKTIRYIETFQLMSPNLWNRFVNQFREHSDTDNGWRGEYWGKMMRGACFTYSYTKNEVLYGILTQTVKDMMNCCDSHGRISSYPLEMEFKGWDIWCRKYVLLGMQYYIEICQDNHFVAEIIESMCRQADYIITKIGAKEEEKIPITEATSHWRGLNSVSVLEPIVRLYNITRKKRYLDFATYIVQTGGTSVVDIFELAFENEFYPYQYPVTKAYEMISCFDGLLEYYRITKIEKYKISIINFANRILESDFTIIGCSGCTHELFDHSTVRQTNTTNGAIVQETCVTVTLMKFFYQLTLLTGEHKYVDAFERSMYNAYFGSVNTERVIEQTIQREYHDIYKEPLPFDSYSPLTAGTRGNGVGGFKIMADQHYYGCCACIGAAGSGLIPKMALVRAKQGIAVNLYMPGLIQTKTPAGNSMTVQIETDYPRNGNVNIYLSLDAEEEFVLMLRNPYWSKTTTVSVNGEKTKANEGYILIHRKWKNEDVIELLLDMRTEVIYPISYGEEILMNKVIWGQNYMVSTYDREDPLAKNHLALRRGPLVLAVDNRLGLNVDVPVSILVNDDGYVDVVHPEKDIAPYEHIIELNIPTVDNKFFTVTDYASAGKLWSNESKIAAWIRISK